MRLPLFLSLFVMVALLAAQTGAVVAPVLQSSFDTGSSGSSFVLASEEGSSNIILFENTGAGCALQTFSQGGTLLESIIVGSNDCTPRDVKWSGGDLLLAYCSKPPAMNWVNSYAVIDYDPGFSVVSYGVSYSDATGCSVGAARPVSITGSAKTFYVTSWSASHTPGKIERLANGTFYFTPATVYINTVDEFQNGDYVIVGANLVDISDPDNNVILDTASSTIVAHDGANEYLTDAGRLVINNVGLFQESTNALTFEPVFFGDRNSILGLSNSWWYAGNFEDVPPSSLNLSTEVTNWKNFPTFGNTPYESDGKIYYYNWTGKTMTIWRATGDFLVDNNTAPDYTLEFLGVDDVEEEFVFAVTMSDEQGGRLYRALDVSLEDDAFTGGDRRYFNDFAELTDFANVFDYSEQDLRDYLSNFYLGFISPQEFNSSRITQTFNTGYQSFDIDGALQLNQTYPKIVGGFDVITPDIDSDVVNITTNFVFTDDEYMSLDIRSLNELSVTRAFFQLFNSSLYFYLDDAGTPIPFNYTSWLDGTSYLRANIYIDFTTRQVTWNVYDGHNNTLLASTTIDTVGTQSQGVNVIRYGGTSSDPYIYVDDILIYYEKAQDYPRYYLFSTTDPEEIVVKDVRVAHEGYGTYVATLFGTDDTLGTDYYQNPVTLTFVYDSRTEVLSDAEIAALITELQADAESGFVEGDLWTDTISGFLDDFGVKTTGSKFIIGLAILILITIAMYGFGSEVVILVDVATIVMLTFLGLWPVWVTVVIAMIAAALAAMAIRRATLGR